MRLIFEIRDLVYASPATVSRAGILFISDVCGYQWKSFVKSWIKSKRYTDDIKDQLQGLFEKYLPDTLLHLKKFFKFIVPVVDIQMIISICKLLESILDKEEVKGLEYYLSLLEYGLSEQDLQRSMGKITEKTFRTGGKTIGIQ